MQSNRIPRITYDDSAKRWVMPPEWNEWEFIVNSDNYPDPDFKVFANEYDYTLKHERGILYRYNNHVLGAEIEYRGDNGKSHIRIITPKTYQYFLFCRAAVTLINEPERYRPALEGALNGGVVIGYANMCTIENLIPPNTIKREETEKMYNNLAHKKRLISQEFGALMARTFNATSGLLLHNIGKQYELKVDARKDKYALCPSCRAIYTQLTREIVEANTSEHKIALHKLIKQIEYDEHKREHG